MGQRHKHEKEEQTVGLELKPELVVQKLPRCPRCHAPHPLSAKVPPKDASVCPRCGGPTANPEDPFTVEAAAHGATIGIGKAFLALGRALFRLAQRI